MTSCALLVALTLVQAAAPQVQAGGEAARGVAQISAPEGGATVGQISRPATPGPGQLNLERGLPADPRQLSSGERSAEGPAALSTPAQGRRATAAGPIGGADACDPRRPPSGRTAADCTRVLETRSAEFERPEPTPLSPEQRLLADRSNTGESGVDARSVARRAAAGAVSEDDLASQAVAASVLGARAEDDEEDRDDRAPGTPVSDVAGALIDIITGQTGGAGNPIVVNPPPR